MLAQNFLGEPQKSNKLAFPLFDVLGGEKSQNRKNEKIWEITSFTWEWGEGETPHYRKKHKKGENLKNAEITKRGVCFDGFLFSTFHLLPRAKFCGAHFWEIPFTNWFFHFPLFIKKVSIMPLSPFFPFPQ